MTGRYNNNTDLLAAFHKGESQAEKQVFQQYFKPLCLYSSTITGQLQASEDIVAESFAKAWARRGEFATLDNLKAFLYRIVRNGSLNHAEGERRQRLHHERLRYMSGVDGVEEEVSALEILRVELLQAIYAEMEHLPDRCGQIFKLIFIEHLTTDEIAARLSINVQTVRTQKARAIQLIRTELLRKNRVPALLIFASMLAEIR